MGEKVEKGRVEVGIVTLPVKSAKLKTIPIFRDQLLWMVNPQNRLAKLDAVAVSEIAREPMLLPKTGYTRRLMDKLLKPHAAELQVRMELPSVGMIKRFVAAGLGLFLLSPSFARDPLSPHLVTSIPPPTNNP